MVFVRSRYAETRTNAAAVNAATLPGGVIQGPSAVLERPTHSLCLTRCVRRRLPSGRTGLKAVHRSLFCQGCKCFSIPQPPPGASNEERLGRGTRESGRNIVPGFGLWQLIGNSHETKFNRLLRPDGFARSRPLPNRESKACLLPCPEFSDQDVHRR